MLLFKSILPLVLLTAVGSCAREGDMARFVTIYPGAPVVEIPGDAHSIGVLVRNVSEIKLTGLRLEVKTEACSSVKIVPPTVAGLIPGDRTRFTVEMVRDRRKARQRYPLALTLYATGLPAPAGLDLMADTSPPLQRGWINVGQVKLVSGTASRTSYWILAGAPLVVLLGWLLWRWSRPRRATGEPPPAH